MTYPSSRRWFRTALTATAALALGTLAACSGPTSNETPAGEKDFSILRLATSTEPASWDPALQSSAFDGVWRWTAVYDTLLTCNPDGTVGPGAAETFEFTDSNTVLTLHLREGMVFEDGSAIDSAAVRASIEHMQTGGGSDAGRVADVTIQTPDPQTVVLTSPEPRGLLPAYMCLAPGIIASPGALSAGSDAEPVASGPYALDPSRTTSGSVYTFTKRDDFWNAEAYPYSELQITVMTDVTARLNALKTGQVDGAVINQQTVAEAEASSLSVSTYVDATNGVVIFDRDGTGVPALGDVRVRQALNMVFDRAAIASGLFQGDVEPTVQIFGPETEAYVAELDDRYPFDIEGAKALLAEAGYADGFSLEIPSRTPQTDQANPLIVQQLAELNISVTEVPLAGPTAVPEILSGRFPMTYISMPTVTGLWDTQQAISPNATWNALHNQTPELTALTDTAQTAQGEELTSVLQEINRYTVENAWFVPWNYRVAYFATAGDTELLTVGDAYTKIPRLQDFR